MLAAAEETRRAARCDEPENRTVAEGEAARASGRCCSLRSLLSHEHLLGRVTSEFLCVNNFRRLPNPPAMRPGAAGDDLAVRRVLSSCCRAPGDMSKAMDLTPKPPSQP